jgi:hypothetical protein
MRESYTTYQLQQKLEKHFGDAIVVQCQQGQGMSNIVYSSSIWLSEAIDHFTVWYLFRNTLNTLGSIFRRNFVHFSVVFKGFVFAKYASCPIDLSTCSNFKSTRPTSASCNQNPSSKEDNFTIVTRSRASEIDWTACIFCKHNALIECIFMLWHRRFLDLCFYISKQISCYARWMIQSIFGKVFRRHFEDHSTVWYLFRNTLQLSKMLHLEMPNITKAVTSIY